MLTSNAVTPEKGKEKKGGEIHFGKGASAKNNNKKFDLYKNLQHFVSWDVYDLANMITLLW